MAFVVFASLAGRVGKKLKHKVQSSFFFFSDKLGF